MPGVSVTRSFIAEASAVLSQPKYDVRSLQNTTELADVSQAAAVRAVDVLMVDNREIEQRISATFTFEGL